ncbi:reverse transcriptase domain-containing protein [Tanacetum coccineum]|uniref:Reverse transcriptase domain-containing protein n=1 Tax=Tanacetum coccineum TaxID=301880 RepID=A0ABQ5BSS1_9ASTR
MAPKRTTRARPAPETTTTTTSVTNAQLQAMIDQGVTAALAARDATRNGDDSHTSGTGVRRTERVARECTYQDFMKCQPLYFKGTEGVVELTQWIFDVFEFNVRIVGHDVAYAMTWIELRKKMTDKYCPRNEIKKLEAELWNLKVKGTDVTGYNQRFQELALLCVRMFPEESDKVERQNVAQAYAAGTGERKEYAGTLPLCNKCKVSPHMARHCKKRKLHECRHLTRDCLKFCCNKQSNNLTSLVCGNQGHYKSDCPELKNQNHGNQANGLNTWEWCLP